MAPHSDDLDEAKRRVRSVMAGVGRGDDAALIARLRGVLSEPRRVAAFVWPLADEPDLRPLMESFDGQGRIVLLPVVVGAGRALVFRRWRLGCAMERGLFGTTHPARGPVLVPDDILVPVVAFDAGRNRLGRGGGFYDRTLAVHRTARAVGFAFEDRRVQAVPVASHDRRLDVVVTDRGRV